MEGKHTPGPWHLGLGNGAGSIFGPEGTRRTSQGLFPICSVALAAEIESGLLLIEEDFANACLIAAAPDLLAACKAMVAAMDNEESLDDVMIIQAAYEACQEAIGNAERGSYDRTRPS